MDLDSIIFYDNLPSIDLHGLDRDTARVKVLEFINDNLKLKNAFVCIIHGIGSGVLKTEVHNTLRMCKYVSEYKLFYNNSGCTIVKINIDTYN
ncbi:MAG: Smr/MutS family protein [bacterium]|nr:Smr/MutS family protein [bacterium]